MANNNYGRKPYIKGLILHTSFHADEAICVWLFKRFGALAYHFPHLFQERFWNIKFFPLDEIPTPKELLESQRIAFGGGGGEFDEHPSGEKKRDYGACAATLLARKLGIDSDPRLLPILEYVSKNDLKGTRGFMDIKHRIQLMQKANEHPVQILRNICYELDMWFDYEQVPFFTAKQEIERASQRREIRIGEKTFSVLLVESDSEEAHKVAMHVYKPLFTAVKRSNGNCQIFFNQRRKDQVGIFNDVAKVITAAEAERWHGLGAREGTFSAQEGHSSSPIWHITPGAFIMNGSRSVKDVPPTRLKSEEILRLIVAACEKQFWAQHKNSCVKGICQAEKGQLCPLFLAKLSHCVGAQEKMKIVA